MVAFGIVRQRGDRAEASPFQPNRCYPNFMGRLIGCLAAFAALTCLAKTQDYLFDNSWEGLAKLSHWPSDFKSANDRFDLHVDYKSQQVSLADTANHRTRWTIPFPNGNAPTSGAVTNDGNRTVLYDLVVKTNSGLWPPWPPAEALLILDGSGKQIQQSRRLTSSAS